MSWLYMQSTRVAWFVLMQYRILWRALLRLLLSCPCCLAATPPSLPTLHSPKEGGIYTPLHGVAPRIGNAQEEKPGWGYGESYVEGGCGLTRALRRLKIGNALFAFCFLRLMPTVEIGVRPGCKAICMDGDVVSKSVGEG